MAGNPPAQKGPPNQAGQACAVNMRSRHAHNAGYPPVGQPIASGEELGVT